MFLKSPRQIVVIYNRCAVSHFYSPCALSPFPSLSSWLAELEEKIQPVSVAVQANVLSFGCMQLEKCLNQKKIHVTF